MTEIKGKFAQAMSDRMEEMGLNIQATSELCGTTYEHIRKIAGGAAFPSKHMEEIIIEKLGLPKQKTRQILVEDRARKKGWLGTMAGAAGKNPELEPLEMIWDSLRPEQKQAIISTAQSFATSNKITKHRRAG